MHHSATRHILFASLITAIFLTAFMRQPTTGSFASRISNPEPPQFMDDTYYKIPDSVAYNGMPTVNKSGLLTLTTELGHNYYIPGDTVNNTGFLYAEVKADDYVPANKKRAPINVCLVIDRSGSMAGDKLKFVKKAADFLIDKLNERDLLSIVVYETSVGVLQKTLFVEDKNALHDIVAQIETAGGTNLGGGMIEGFNQVKSAFKNGYVNRVLLLSDGLANEGVKDPAMLNDIAKKWFTTEGISISTFGVGNDYNENLMTALAENGGGNYYYIKDPGQIPVLFEKEVNGLITLLAKSAIMKVSLPPQMIVSRVYGANYEMDKNVMTIKLNDLFANETKGILVKYKIRPEAKTELPISTRLDFEDVLQNNTPAYIQNLNVVKPVYNVKQYLSNFSERVMQQCTMFESNDMLERTMKAVDQGDYDMARSYGAVTKYCIVNNKAKFTSTPEISKQDSVVYKYNEELMTIDIKTASEVKEVQKASKSANYMIRTKKE